MLRLVREIVFLTLVAIGVIELMRLGLWAGEELLK